LFFACFLFAEITGGRAAMSLPVNADELAGKTCILR